MPPTPPHCQRKLFTPTKKAIASVLHDTFNWSYTNIAAFPRLGGLNASTVRKGLKGLAVHGGNFYHNGRKGACGRKRRILQEDLELAELELEDPDNDIANGEDLRRELFPDVPGRTVHNSALNFLY
jgi:hypothetical protein